MAKGKFRTQLLRSRPTPAERPTPRNALSISFSYWDKTKPKFSLHETPDGYLGVLLERLKAFSQLTRREFLTMHAKAWRAHPIKFNETTEPDGFGLGEQLAAYEPYQFSLTSNEHGRVHGFFIGDVFFIRWLDPGHKLYA